jgi:hypothetical protein
MAGRLGLQGDCHAGTATRACAGATDLAQQLGHGFSATARPRLDVAAFERFQ